MTADEAPERLAKRMDGRGRNLMVDRLAEVPLAEVVGVITRLFDRIESLMADVKRLRDAEGCVNVMDLTRGCNR